MAEDVIAVLTKDHREVEQMFAEFESLERGGMADSGGVRKQQRDIADKVIMELVRHSVAEEEYLYPAAREHLPNGGEIADRELREHAEAEETMNSLDGMDPDNPEFTQRMHTLMQEIRQHVQEEEGELFPALRSSMSQQQLDELGDKVTAAKKIAPTHPHPRAPDTPPGNKLLGPGVALVDRIRDALSGRGK
jgi:hemerythrin-like domain-containing protein